MPVPGKILKYCSDQISSSSISYQAMMAHQMKLKPTRADAPVKLRRCVMPPLAVGLVTATGGRKMLSYYLITKF